MRGFPHWGCEWCTVSFNGVRLALIRLESILILNMTVKLFKLDVGVVVLGYQDIRHLTDEAPEISCPSQGAGLSLAC